MSKVIKLKKGLDIKLVGAAEKTVVEMPVKGLYASCPTDYEGCTPKILVKVGDVVKAGSPLYFDKNRPEVMFCSPVSGVVNAINRGEKRKVLSVVVEADGKQESETFATDLAALSREELVKTLLDSGLWSLFLQRPYGVIPSPAVAPRAIFISAFDSAPLAADMAFVLEGEKENLQKGIEVLSKLTDGKVYVGLKSGVKSVCEELQGAEKYYFDGPHPAGNVGVQIHHIAPVSAGEVVWTVNVQDLAIIGRLFRTGAMDMTRTVAVTGSQIEKPQYVKCVAGAPVNAVVAAAGGLKAQKEGESVRLIDGNVLTGTKRSADDYCSIKCNQITAIPEGDKYEFLGWAMPRLNKFSASHSYFSWLCPKKEYDLDTNLNGGVRAYVVTGLYEKLLPMDIYPMYLLKAILAQDFDKMIGLGIYEVVEEDVALCEFADPSKTEIQTILRDGINLMIKEM